MCLVFVRVVMSFRKIDCVTTKAQERSEVDGAWTLAPPHTHTHLRGFVIHFNPPTYLFYLSPPSLYRSSYLLVQMAFVAADV